jgi:hypothetical protein
VHEAGHILLGGGVSTGETLTLSIEGFKGTTRPIDRSVASLLGGYGAVITLSLLFLLVKDWKINLMVLSMITQMLVYALDFNTLYSDSQALVAMGAWWSVPLVVIISMAITIICMARISWLEKIVVANTGKVSKVD